MARVTVEDCIEKVSNRFELVHVAAQRSREISNGARLTIKRDNDKNPVVALREIAGSTVEVETLKESLIRSKQKFIPHDEEADEMIDFMEGEAEWDDLPLADEGELEMGGFSAENYEDADNYAEATPAPAPSFETSVPINDENMIGVAVVPEEPGEGSEDDENLIG